MARLRTSLLLLALIASACGVGSPVDVTNRPLSERMEDRRADQDAAAEVARQQAVDTAGGTDALDVSAAPEALALADEVVFASAGLVLVMDGNGAGAELKEGPGSGYQTLRDVPFNASVRTLGSTTGEWTYVAYGDTEGWMFVRLLTLHEAGSLDATPPAPSTYVVTGADVGINMRARPDSSSQLVSGAPTGSIVTGTGRTDGEWIEITFHGVTGWAFGSYLVVSS